MRRIMGEVFDFAEMQKIAAFAREGGSDCTSTAPGCSSLRLHGDLARDLRGIVRHRLCVALQIFQRRFGCDPRRAAAFAGNLYHERRMFGGGLNRYGPMRLWRYTISTAFPIVTPAPWRRPKHCLSRLASIRAARSRGDRPVPMWCACTSRAPMPLRYPSYCAPAAS